MCGEPWLEQGHIVLPSEAGRYRARSLKNKRLEKGPERDQRLEGQQRARQGGDTEVRKLGAFPNTSKHIHGLVSLSQVRSWQEA